MKRLLLASIFILASLFFPQVALAREGQVLGVHILNINELDLAQQLLATDQTKDDWHYLTVPFSLEDSQRLDQWQRFFNNAQQQKMIPLVRLVTKFNSKIGAWEMPSRKDITTQLNALSSLEWPTERRHIIVFNEVNHATEWGGQIDPASYTETLRFASLWARSENKNFVILPAAMDLAAPQGSSTWEAFNYLRAMQIADPEIFTYIDAWNSHAYPNPGFSSSPTLTSKNSVRGFEHELAFLKKETGKDFSVYITETGWIGQAVTQNQLASYYTYALQHVWSHPQVVAVTPFVLRGDPGPFSQFSFFDRNSAPTKQYFALRQSLENVQAAL